LLPEALELSESELSLLAVLMLRGAQTPGELKQRTERLYGFGSLADIETTLQELIGRELAVRLPRRPGQKEERYAHALGGEDGEAEAARTLEPAVQAGLEERVARLEAEVRSLRDRLDSA
jgi:uncharacterized protein YceH (UPF0502 family)